MEGWAKIKDAADYASVGQRTLRKWFKQGLRYSRLETGAVFIRYADIDKFLESFSVDGNQVDQIVDEVFKDLSLPNSNE
jgi:predicted site-specific integrase-resolvase